MNQMSPYKNKELYNLLELGYCVQLEKVDGHFIYKVFDEDEEKVASGKVVKRRDVSWPGFHGGLMRTLQNVLTELGHPDPDNTADDLR